MRFATILMALIMLACGPAAAADCAPLKLLNTVKMEPAGGNPDEVRLVPVVINDKTKMFMLDTGGYASQITRTAAADLNLELQNSPIELYDVNGRVSRKSVTLEKLQVGRMVFSRVRLPVSTFDGGIDGILSSNLLVAYDIDLDFPANVMNYISPDHCAGAVMYWKADAVGVVPITLINNSEIKVKVTLDGQTFDAMIDTGATHSTMSDKVAKYFFNIPLGAVGDTTLTAYRHIFSKLAFGGVTIEKPQIDILEDRVNRNADHAQQTGNRALTVSNDITLPKMVIGMNMLKDLHIYMSFSEHRLYLTQTVPAKIQ
jgi:predicted aspartyl protease